MWLCGKNARQRTYRGNHMLDYGQTCHVRSAMDNNTR